MLTDFGKLFLIIVVLLLIFSIWLTQKWAKRLSNGERGRWFEYGYLFLVVFSISSLFFPFAYMLPQGLYNLIAKPTYEATITDYQTERRRDSDGRNYFMHTPIVTFIDSSQQQISIQGSVASGDVPIVGNKVTVVYRQGDVIASEKSVRAVLLLLAGLVMTSIMGFLLLSILAYAYGHNMRPYKETAIFFIFKLLIPLATIAMLVAFCFVLYRYFILNNPNNYPIWVVCLCGFFTVSLLPVIYNLLKGWRVHSLD